MPELAEVKIMSEYINSISKGKIYTNSRKSDVTKVKTEMENPFEGVPFTIEARSRGKELLLVLKSIKGNDARGVKFAMGMSGNWYLARPEEQVKHAHLMFDRSDGYTLCMVDVRRFAKWGWTETWGDKRGPCPLSEFEEFYLYIHGSAANKAFQKPIYEVLMNQSYFNGIGNYLRAEILHRLDINPFQKAFDVVMERGDGLIKMCHDVCQEAYLVGGGELKDWDNPFKRGYGRGRINEKMNKLADTSFRDWLECYGKMEKIDDSKGRKFWYNKKWNNE